MEEQDIEKEAGLQPELDDLRRENSRLAEQVLEAHDALARLQETVAQRDSEVVVLREAAEAARSESNSLSGSLAEAVGAYRDLIVRPGLPPDLVTGGTIAEINESAEKARALVEQVRQDVAAENARQQVPAGAPPRTIPDVSALSAREKIRFALGAKAG